MTSFVRSSPEHHFWRGLVAGAAFIVAAPGLAAAGAMDECTGAPKERTACLESLELEVVAELASTQQAAVELYAGLDAITGNQRASRTLGQGQAAFELYRDLDCNLVELQVGAGTDSADHRRACQIDHDRKRTATLAAHLPEPPASAAAADAPAEADTTEADTADAKTADAKTAESAMSENDATGNVAATPMILDSSWRVVEITGEPVAEGVEPSLSIAADGAISGSGGCNRYFGKAEIDADRLTMGDVGSTRMACPEPAMGEEQRYLEALDAIARWQLDDDELTFADDSGTVLVRLQRSAD